MGEGSCEEKPQPRGLPRSPRPQVSPASCPCTCCSSLLQLCSVSCWSCRRAPWRPCSCTSCTPSCPPHPVTEGVGTYQALPQTSPSPCLRLPSPRAQRSPGLGGLLWPPGPPAAGPGAPPVPLPPPAGGVGAMEPEGNSLGEGHASGPIAHKGQSGQEGQTEPIINPCRTLPQVPCSPGVSHSEDPW